MLKLVYKQLYKTYGTQQWWPADTPFEVMVGAVLTQNTAWRNVERAIENLRVAGCLEPDCIVGTRTDQLAEWLRPSGYFNIKARRLQNFCRWYLEQGGYQALRRQDDRMLRDALLGVNGIGPETADDILLYAFDRPVFVIDAYTRRMFGRLGLITGHEHYEVLRSHFEAGLRRSGVPVYKEYHALIVNHAKHVCRRKPDCSSCCVRQYCRKARDENS